MKGNGAALNLPVPGKKDKNQPARGIQSIDECRALCQFEKDCNCIVYAESAKFCYLRQFCDISKCRQGSYKAITGMRTDTYGNYSQYTGGK